MLEYLPVAVTPFPERELARRAERHRLMVEHAEQIVPRRTSIVRRMLRIVVRRSELRARPCEAAAAR